MAYRAIKIRDFLSPDDDRCRTIYVSGAELGAVNSCEILSLRVHDSVDKQSGVLVITPVNDTCIIKARTERLEKQAF